MGDNKEVKIGDLFRDDERDERMADRRRPNLEPKRERESDYKSKSYNSRGDKKSNPKRWKRVLTVVGAIVVVGLICWGIYSYIELSKLQDPEYAKQQANEETLALVEKVSKLMELPDGEPVVATVSDKTKLEDQLFFEKAEDGDRVLIFPESSIAIIYRESTNKIINSGPIAITADEDSTEAITTEDVEL
jgi:hypothetical protein